MDKVRQPKIVEYQDVPESYGDLKRLHALLEYECGANDGRTVIGDEQIAKIKQTLADELPELEDIDTFFKKGCLELVICRAFRASNVFSRYVFAQTMPFTTDLYNEAFSGAPGLQTRIIDNISSRYIPPLYGPHLTNSFASKMRRSQ